MKRIVGASAAALMAMSVLVGCGGGGGGGGGLASGNYCGDLKSAKDAVSSLGNGALTQAKFDELSADLHGIASEAPADVKDDWSTLAQAIDSLKAALDKAGVSLDDLQNLGSGGATIDPATLQALTEAAKSMDSDAITKSTDAIAKEVKSECNLVIGSTG
jgi:hypothetical protein